jgi:hypothetical protein
MEQHFDAGRVQEDRFNSLLWQVLEWLKKFGLGRVPR